VVDLGVHAGLAQLVDDLGGVVAHVRDPVLGTVDQRALDGRVAVGHGGGLHLPGGDLLFELVEAELLAVAAAAEHAPGHQYGDERDDATGQNRGHRLNRA